MNLKKILYKVLFALFLLFALSVNSCKRKCWHCGDPTINWIYYERVCGDGAKAYHESHGDNCF